MYLGIYSSANTNAVVGLTDVVAEMVRLKKVTELRRGRYLTLKQQSPSLCAVGCAGSGKKMWRGKTRGRRKWKRKWRIGRGKRMRRRGGKGMRRRGMKNEARTREERRGKGREEKEERVVEGKEEGKRKEMERRTGWVGRAPEKKRQVLNIFTPLLYTH